jgi:hypothetical protein
LAPTLKIVHFWAKVWVNLTDMSPKGVSMPVSKAVRRAAREAVNRVTAAQKERASSAQPSTETSSGTYVIEITSVKRKQSEKRGEYWSVMGKSDAGSIYWAALPLDSPIAYSKGDRATITGRSGRLFGKDGDITPINKAQIVSIVSVAEKEETESGPKQESLKFPKQPSEEGLQKCLDSLVAKFPMDEILHGLAKTLKQE